MEFGNGRNKFEVTVRIWDGTDCLVGHEPIFVRSNGCSCDVYRELVRMYKEAGKKSHGSVLERIRKKANNDIR